MAKTQSRTALVSSKTFASGDNGRLDCTAVDGGIITLRITNAGTGPTAQVVARILVAHKDTSMPAAGAEGTGDLDWKQVYEIGGGTTLNVSTRGVYRFGPEVAYLQVRFDNGTGTAPTVEAHATTYTY